MKQPRLKIELDTGDRIVQLIGFLGLIVLIGLPVYFYDQLPDMIPRHFGANGKPDAFSGKNMIWLLPIIGSVLCLGLFWLNKYPHNFNYPQKITEENAERLYRSSTKMIRMLNAAITCGFAYITYATIQTAVGNKSGLGIWFLPIFLVVVYLPVVYFSWFSKRETKRL